MRFEKRVLPDDTQTGLNTVDCCAALIDAVRGGGDRAIIKMSYREASLCIELSLLNWWTNGAEHWQSHENINFCYKLWKTVTLFPFTLYAM